MDLFFWSFCFRLTFHRWGGGGGKGISLLGLDGQRGRPHGPPRLDNNSSYNHLSSFISDLSWVISALSRVIWALTCFRTIAWTTEEWELKPDYKEPTIDTLQPIHISSIVMFMIPQSQFLSGPPDDPTSNHKSGLSSRWIERSSLYTSYNRVFYVS
jgi:hypothetical protein